MRISDWGSDVCSSDLRQPIQTLIASMSLPFLGLIGFGLAIWENRRNPARPRGWMAVATLAAFSFAFCFFQTRAAPTAQVLGLSGAAMIAWSLIRLAHTISPPQRARSAERIVGKECVSTGKFRWALNKQ